jgi:putative glutathione S-transferase
MMDKGWTFEQSGPAQGDTLFQSKFAHEIYTQADPNITTRVTVPILWDKKTNTIVSNESPEIIRMLNSAFDDITGNTDDYWPTHMREDIEVINARIYSDIKMALQVRFRHDTTRL